MLVPMPADTAALAKLRALPQSTSVHVSHEPRNIQTPMAVLAAALIEVNTVVT